jgi:endoglucanase
MKEGYNTFRVPFLMERMAPGGVSAAFNQAYLTNYTVAINYITNNGGFAVIDPHNFGRYNGAIISDTNAFGAFWKTLATAFKSNSKVVSHTRSKSCIKDANPVRFSTQTTSTTTWTKPWS